MVQVPTSLSFSLIGVGQNKGWRGKTLPCFQGIIGRIRIDARYQLQSVIHPPTIQNILEQRKVREGNAILVQQRDTLLACAREMLNTRAIVKKIAEIDFSKYDDYFCWKVGGDGDKWGILIEEMNGALVSVRARLAEIGVTLD